MSRCCDICHRNQATETHHLVFGTANRKKADEDGLTLRICRECHRAIHEVPAAGHLSKMLGQATYEKEHAREDFMARYGMNFLPERE